MPKKGTHTQTGKAKTQGLYDRIADVHNLALRLNGYRNSVAKYLRSLDLKIDSDSLVLDAGCGTGIVSLAFQDAAFDPKRAIALDLSFKSLKVAREQFLKRRKHAKITDIVQGNILSLPFVDQSFDLILMCGVLEYTPLDAGLREAARVLKKGAPLVLLPVKPSIVGSVLELLYKFKIHPLDNVRVAATRYFNIVGNHEFPITEPIAWSKTIFLLEKK
ncbi:MAG TPA: class I SAM-dependent methyltransferase [Pyrinomonadaceae bacterium]|nr:class I SAM-dependent methyltransferase [Chloracidobacterium sp.]MBP9935469.1 class I SAM-dependent methyltransferase [Pyrinomonadaceae bacterium]MBK7801916.1 class I SAM-dependent methyltransferase [Chloracidobacterium sp.]MBK9437941.1 class I SAM-dependent methyltransferase [Chloracidobacterium sp.]MBK9765632.1 class I SAM-dependent methyltransferase [Chloracidobacterium sp.]